MTVLYLEANRTAVPQYRAPRREKPAGIIGLHTSESIMDTVGPDTGAENVASWITRRTDYGSYHDLVDSDSWVPLVRYENEAFHIGTHRLNRSTTGLAWACRTTDWSRMEPWRREAFLRAGARCAARQARYHAAHGRPVRPVRLTLEEGLAGGTGFLYHGDADPGRRTDPGTTPAAPFPWAEFLGYVEEEFGTTTTTPGARMSSTEAREIRAVISEFKMKQYAADVARERLAAGRAMRQYAADVARDKLIAAQDRKIDRHAMLGFVKDTEQDEQIAEANAQIAEARAELAALAAPDPELVALTRTAEAARAELEALSVD